MELTLSAAAQATGKGKSTLLRAVKSGKLSSRRTEEGIFMVDASELARVFHVKHLERTINAPLSVNDAVWSASEPPDAPDAEKAVLQTKVTMLEDQLARERETVDDLRKRLDRAEERVHALTYQAQQERPKAVSFWSRILGR
jgi:hypothetical protein